MGGETSVLGDSLRGKRFVGFSDGEKNMMKKISRSLFLVTLIFSPAANFVFAASSSDDLVNAARKEGKLVIYSTSTVEPGEKSFGQKMKETYPWLEIDEVLMSSGSRLLERLFLEIQSGKTPDIAHMGSGQMGQLKDKGLLQPYRSPVEENFIGGFKIDHRMWTPSNFRSIHTIYNSKIVKADQLAAGYDALLDPRWKGQVGVDIGGTFWQFWTAVELRRGEDKGTAFMRRLGNNEARPYFSNNQIRNLVASGELTFGIYIYLNNVISMQKQGAPLAIWNADPVGYFPSVHGIMKNARNLNAAKLYIEWLLGRETQQWMAQQEIVVPVRRDVENPHPQYFKDVPFVIAGAEETDPRVPRLREEYKKHFRVQPPAK
jgi:ABC-type Fe3+ transport system substrate-binding protein